VNVCSGPYSGRMGTLYWIYREERTLVVALQGWQKLNSPADDEDIIAVPPETAMINMDDAEFEAPPTLQYSTLKGYDMSVGDVVAVAHGPNFGIWGPIHSVDFTKACLTVISSEDAMKVCH
jgi:hypothetical protein